MPAVDPSAHGAYIMQVTTAMWLVRPMANALDHVFESLTLSDFAQDIFTLYTVSADLSFRGPNRHPPTR